VPEHVARAANPGVVEREDGTPLYGAAFDEVVAQLHIARMQRGSRCSPTR
jgi:hypothetical protein